MITGLESHVDVLPAQSERHRSQCIEHLIKTETNANTALSLNKTKDMIKAAKCSVSNRFSLANNRNRQ